MHNAVRFTAIESLWRGTGCRPEADGYRLLAAGFRLLTDEKLFLHKFANDKRPEASGQ